MKTSVDDATGGSVPDETHLDDDGLWIPPEFQTDKQLVIRTPRSTIQHWGEFDSGYYGMVTERDFGNVDDIRNPQNGELAPDKVSLKIAGEDAHVLEVVQEPEAVADGGVAFDSADEAADALEEVITAAEPALSEDERATATAVSQFLAREEDGYTPIEKRLKDISDEIRSDHGIGEAAYFGDIGVHTFFDAERSEMPVGETTLLLMAFDNLTEELWLDEDIIRDNHGEVTAETVAAEVESQCEEFIGQFHAFERLASHVEEVYREFENADNTEGGD